MNKTILIGMNNSFSVAVNKWLFGLTGLLFLVNGVFHIYSNTYEPVGLILGVFMLIGGLFHTFYAIFGFSKHSKFSSKVKVDDVSIELKNSIWKRGTTLHWTDLSSIKFQPYGIVFQLQHTSNVFSYNVNSDTSRTIKQTIREFAEQKNIEVIGG